MSYVASCVYGSHLQRNPFCNRFFVVCANVGVDQQTRACVEHGCDFVAVHSIRLHGMDSRTKDTGTNEPQLL